MPSSHPMVRCKDMTRNTYDMYNRESHFEIAFCSLTFTSINSTKLQQIKFGGAHLHVLKIPIYHNESKTKLYNSFNKIQAIPRKHPPEKNNVNPDHYFYELDVKFIKFTIKVLSPFLNDASI